MNAAEETAPNSFNKGLALLLKKDLDNAATGFGSAIEQNADYAKAYYAAAVTAATSSPVVGDFCAGIPPLLAVYSLQPLW